MQAHWLPIDAPFQPQSDQSSCHSTLFVGNVSICKLKIELEIFHPALIYRLLIK